MASAVAVLRVQLRFVDCINKRKKICMVSSRCQPSAIRISGGELAIGALWVAPFNQHQDVVDLPQLLSAERLTTPTGTIAPQQLFSHRGRRTRIRNTRTHVPRSYLLGQHTTSTTSTPWCGFRYVGLQSLSILNLDARQSYRSKKERQLRPVYCELNND